MTRLSIRGVGLLWFVSLLAVLAAFAWIASGVMGTASAQDGDDAAVSGSDQFPPAEEGPGPESWFIKIGDIEGESRDKDHEGWSDILSLSQSIQRPSVPGAASGRPAAGGPTFEPFVFRKKIDKATPKLQEAIATGQVFPEVAIHLAPAATDAGRRESYYAYELKNVQVVNYNLEGTNNNRPVENVMLTFEEIKVTYIELRDDGSEGDVVEFTWNVEEGAR